MNAFFGPAVLIAALASSIAANAHGATSPGAVVPPIRLAGGAAHSTLSIGESPYGIPTASSDLVRRRSADATSVRLGGRLAPLSAFPIRGTAGIALPALALVDVVSPAPSLSAVPVPAAPVTAGPSGAPATSAPASPLASPPQITRPSPGTGAIQPGSLSGSQEQTWPAGGASPPADTVSPSPTAAPVPSPTATGRFHLQRPGTDVEGDRLTGNAANDIYIFRGNVVLHSDPKVDKAFAGATESDELITVTADEIDVDRANLSYVAKGSVHFSQGNRSGRADTAMLNEQTHDLDLIGNADVLQGDHRARAAKMHYNVADRQFHGSGDIRIYQPVPTPGPRASSTPAPKRRLRLPL